MSISGSSNAAFAGFDFSLLAQGRYGRSSATGAGTADAGAAAASTGGGAAAGDFRATLRLRMAEFQSQTFGTLFSANAGSGIGRNSPGSTDFSALFGETQGAGALDWLTGAPGATPGLSATGRNMTLFDPESAYRMMTVINNKDVTYKAEFAEMGDMKSYLATMRQEALHLGQMDGATGNDEIRTRLQAFADAYNGWIRRFDEALQSGGLLAGTQAAQVSQWELEQSVESIFNGAADGLRGMRDLGLNIDPVSNLASLDGSRLDAVLAGNKTGAINTVREFSANFAKSAELLNADGNFIPNRLDNLARVIDYIRENKQALQAEFGLGDPARPSAQVARALASYNAMAAA